MKDHITQENNADEDTSDERKKVLIIDDHPFVIRGLEETTQQLGLKPTGVNNGKSALQELRTHNYHLILLDIDLPDLNGKTLLQLIRMSHKDTPILIISGSNDVMVIHWLIHNGAQGYINKTQDPEHTCAAIQTLLDGGRYLPPDLQSIITTQQNSQENLAAHVHITPKQKEIIMLVEQGLSNRDIAKKLGIAEATVGTHMKKIFIRLKVNNRTQCAKVAKNLGVI